MSDSTEESVAVCDDQINRITHPKKRAFLRAFTETANVVKAAASARIERSMVYFWLRKDPEFQLAFEEAKRISCDVLESEAVRRATEGVRKLKFHEGVPIMVPLLNDDGSIRYGDDGEPMMTPYVEHDYSDTLLIFLMKGAMPDKYRDKAAGQTNVSVGVAVGVNVNDTCRELLNHPEFLDYCHDRLLDDGSRTSEVDASGVRTNGKPGEVASSEAPRRTESNHNGHHHGQNGSPPDRDDAAEAREE